MKQTIRFGRISGVEVGANWSLLVLILLVADGLATAVLPQLAPGYAPAVYWTAGVLGGLLIAGSLLLHELAHSMVALRSGIPVQRITLWMLGGASSLDGEPASPRTAFWIAASGPLTSLGLGVGAGTTAVLLSAAGAPRLIAVSLWWLGIMNVVLAAFNLLPGLPLDGGRILRAALWWHSGDPNRAAITAGRAGTVIGYLLAGLGFAEWLSGRFTGLWLLIVGFVIVTSVSAETRLTRLRAGLGRTTVGAAMTPLVTPLTTPFTAPLSPRLVTAYAAMPVERFVTEIAPHTSEVVFPVVDLDGAPTGTVSLRRLALVPAARRASSTIADVQRPLADVPVAHPDDLLADLVSRMSPAADELALVTGDDGRLVGVVHGHDIARLVQLATLRPVDLTS